MVLKYWKEWKDVVHIRETCWVKPTLQGEHLFGGCFTLLLEKWENWVSLREEEECFQNIAIPKWGSLTWTHVWVFLGFLCCSWSQWMQKETPWIQQEINTPSQLGGVQMKTRLTNICALHFHRLCKTQCFLSILCLWWATRRSCWHKETHRCLKICSVPCCAPCTHHTYKHKRNHRKFFDPKFSG